MVLALAVFVAGSHARYAVIQATKITIEAPSQSRPGEIYNIRVHASGLPLGAGVEISGDAVRDRRGIEQITRGWNTYRVVAPVEPGFFDLTAQLYAVDEGNPEVCAILTPTQAIWMPLSAMCLSQGLSSARAQIEIVNTR